LVKRRDGSSVGTPDALRFPETEGFDLAISFDQEDRENVFSPSSREREWPLPLFLLRTRNTRVSDRDPYPDGSALIWVAGSGSGSRRAKMTHKNRKKYRMFMFWSAGCSLLRTEGFSCSLGVFYEGLGISKLQFLIKKIKIKFPAVNFSQF
jgi:hypothetical protein